MCLVWAIGTLTILQVVSALRYNDTCLQKLGLQINQTFVKPWGTTDQLMRDIFVYFEELDGIRISIRRCLEQGLDPKTEVWHEYRKFLQVNETGGPEHLQSQVRIRTLIDFYKWGSDEIYEFWELIDFTRKAWKKLLELLDGKTKPVFTIQDKVNMLKGKHYDPKKKYW
jgi:hypothetical protein